MSEPHTAAVMVCELGRQLAALRRAAGLTQHQLAGLMGFSQHPLRFDLRRSGLRLPGRQGAAASRSCVCDGKQNRRLLLPR